MPSPTARVVPPPGKKPQGPIPTLMQLLRTRYTRYLSQLTDVANGIQFEDGVLPDNLKDLTPQKAAALLPQRRTFAGFIEFCEEFLNLNRVTAPWYADDGIGLIFADSTRVTINVQGENANSGQMQQSGAVDVMEGKGFGTVPI